MCSNLIENKDIGKTFNDFKISLIDTCTGHKPVEHHHLVISRFQFIASFDSGNLGCHGIDHVTRIRNSDSCSSS